MPAPQSPCRPEDEAFRERMRDSCRRKPERAADAAVFRSSFFEFRLFYCGGFLRKLGAPGSRGLESASSAFWRA